MKTKDLFFVKLSTFLFYCPLFNPSDRDVLSYIINEDYNGGVAFKKLVRLSGLSKTALVRSLNTLVVSGVVKTEKRKEEVYPRYVFSPDRRTYKLPTSTIQIINEQERLLGIPETFIAYDLRNAEHAYSFLEKNLPGYTQVKKDPFVSAYNKKEAVAQEHLQELRKRHPKQDLSNESENNFDSRPRI